MMNYWPISPPLCQTSMSTLLLHLTFLTFIKLSKLPHIARTFMSTSYTRVDASTRRIQLKKNSTCLTTTSTFSIKGFITWLKSGMRSFKPTAEKILLCKCNLSKSALDHKWPLISSMLLSVSIQVHWANRYLPLVSGILCFALTIELAGVERNSACTWLLSAQPQSLFSTSAQMSSLMWRKPFSIFNRKRLYSCNEILNLRSNNIQ